MVVGIAASGVTPFVRAALKEARKRGAATALVTCNPDVPACAARVVIALAVGPEVLTGSTRLKAGTATKLALNTLTTASFARLGKVYGNRMVDLRPRSAKLRARALGLVRQLGRGPPREAERLLKASGASAKVAIAMARLRVDAPEARRRQSAPPAPPPHAAIRGQVLHSHCRNVRPDSSQEWLGPAVSAARTGVLPRRKSKSQPSWAWSTWSRKRRP
jgi:N-acetylmuramic acid 6-phosphate etherase